jgi:AcrR family transcriptional regulator
LIRCIAYISKATSVCSNDEIQDLVSQAQVKNAALGISGRLFHIDAHFIQVLEGGAAPVGSLFQTIVADPRHRQVVTLLDRPIEQRAFRDWSMQLVAGDDLSEGDLGGLRMAVDRLERVDIWALATSRSLGDLAAGPADALISTAFRVAPRQSRSIGTVERLLAAGEGIVKRTRRLDNVTLEAVAEEAGVTPQAAYRYFRDIDDLILLAMRRVLAVEHERLLAFITAQVFETEADLANATVAFITQAYQEMARIPAAMRDRIARDYHDISYDLLWKVAETIHVAMARRGDPCAGIGAMRLTAGLTAVVAVAKSLFLRDIALLNEPGAQLMMVGVFLGALRGGRPDGGGGLEDSRIEAEARNKIVAPGATQVPRIPKPE